MTSRQWAWLTGFYEGEGCCVCYKSTKHVKDKTYYSYPLAIYICQKDKSVIEYIKSIIGYGYIAKNERTGINKIRMWRWVCTHRKALKFLNNIKPYMKCKEKIKQVARALKLYKLKTNLKRDMTRKEIRRIKRLIKKGIKTEKIAEMTKRNYTTIYDVKRGDYDHTRN